MNFIKSRKFLILLVFLILAALIVLYIVLNQTPTITTSDNFKAPTTQKVKVDDTVVNNFYKNPSYLYVKGDVVIDENSNYQTAYIATQKKFIISIYDASPVSKGLAEQAFLTKLGIDKTAACKLDPIIQTYTDQNGNNPPIISRLSFCK